MTNEEVKESVQRFTKILHICGYSAIIGLMCLNIVLAIRLLPEGDKYENALGDFPPPVVLNRVPGTTGPAARLGDITVVQQERCVNRTTKLRIQTIWTREPPTPGQSFPNAEPFRQNSMKGCATMTLALQMPEKVTPGSWYIQGVVQDEGSGDVKYWTSEILVVVP